MRDLSPGTEFGPWRIERLIGRGGMGVVYLGTDTRLNRPVAIKLIADDRAGDQGFRERFEREAQLTAAIDHPNVIPVYAAGEIDDQLYLATRFVDGTDLQECLRRDGPLSPGRAADIVAQVAGALDAAHAGGLVHRDVKPANILLSHRHVYLSDFGLTRSVEAEARLTDTDERLGTVDFMSPEQLRGDRVDARSDVYALGCVLYTLLEGQPPFHRATAAATITAHLEAAIPRASLRAGVPAAFDSVLERALAKDPEARFQSAGDLGREATNAAQGFVTQDLGHSVARGEAAPLAETRSLPAETHALPAETHALPAETHALPADPGSLPTQALGSGEPAPAPTARVALKENKRRNLWIEAIVAAAFILVAIVVLAVALTDGGKDPNRALTGADVERAANGFARAYSQEDSRAMGRLLSPDVQRVSASDVQKGRNAVLAAYRTQFRSQVTRAYRLADLKIDSGDVGRVEARFTVERAGRPPITGLVVLGVERRSGRVRIRLIATESRT